MVTKHVIIIIIVLACSVLAKIHMVTKLADELPNNYQSSVLAKIHMVTKLANVDLDLKDGSVLAKIHMVTKLRRM